MISFPKEFFDKPEWRSRFLSSKRYEMNFACLKPMSDKEITIDMDLDAKLDLFILLLAISHVKVEYLSIISQSLDDVKDCEKCKKGEKDTEIDLLERTFAYELYRQWQNLLETSGSSLHVDAEIGKKLSDEKINFKKLKAMKGTYREPDLVLHRSQGNNEGQTFACEIKRNVHLDNDMIIKDLIKLFHFIDPNIWGKNPYKYGVFIIVQKDLPIEEHINQMKNLKDQLKCEIDKEKLDGDLERIICIAYNGYSVMYDTLENILEK